MATKVGLLIKKFRIEKNYSQEHLGRKIGGVSNAFISKIESGNATLPINYIEKLCIVLGIKKELLNKAMHLDYDARFNRQKPSQHRRA